MVPRPPRNQLQVSLDSILGREYKQNRLLRTILGTAYFLMTWLVYSFILSIFLTQILSIISPIKYFFNKCIQTPDVYNHLMSIHSSESCTLKAWTRNLLGLASISLAIYALTRPEDPREINKYRD